MAERTTRCDDCGHQVVAGGCADPYACILGHKKLYQPSNGTEGMIFIENFCDQCQHDKAYRDDPKRGQGCDILARTFLYDTDHPDYPKEWHYTADGVPVCGAFTREVVEPEKAANPTPRCSKTVDMFNG